MGLSLCIAHLVKGLRPALLPLAFVTTFALGNAGDAQFEERGAPTEQLLVELRAHQPETLSITGFPYNPWVAKLTTRLVPGWEPGLIVVDEPAPACGLCSKLRWDANSRSYARLADDSIR